MGNSAVCNVGTGVARTGQAVVAAIGQALSRELRIEMDPLRMRASDSTSAMRGQCEWGRYFGLDGDHDVRRRHPRGHQVARPRRQRLPALGRPMRIALVTGHYLPFVGGIESHVQHIARRLAATGDDVTILTQADDRSWKTEEVMEGVLVRRFSVPLPSRHFAISPSLWSELRTRPLPWDIVHAHGYHSVVPLLATTAGARPLVFTPHYHGTGHSPLRKALHVPYRYVGKSIIDASRFVICVSEAERRLLLRHFPSAGGKSLVIPNGVDLEMLEAAEPFSTGRTTIVTGGRLESYKHVDVVLRAVALLGEDCDVVITGDGPERLRLESLARELGIAGRAAF